MGYLLKEIRKIGTVLCTLEEHGMSGSLSGSETIIPMYLADSIIHLMYNVVDGTSYRNLKVIKCRSSNHSKNTHPYNIMKGPGIIVRPQSAEKRRARFYPELPSFFKQKYDLLSVEDKVKLNRVGLPRIVKMVKHLSTQGFSNMSSLITLFYRQ